MARTANKTVFTIGLLVMLMAVPAFGASVNKSVKIAAGEESGGASSVNGSITVGADAVVTGGVRTVNGSIRVDDGAKIEGAKTVNGGIRLGDDVESASLGTVNGTISVGSRAKVSGEIDAVNGRISLASGAVVEDSVENVNGRIEMVAAEVGGDVSTVSGDVELEEASVVRGDLIVEKPNNWGWGKSKSRKPRIVIGPGSRVEGTIVLEREVELFISETAEVGGISGVMTMDDAVRFSGDSP
jgi:DUF4097 and DUF4098 domain-containing protein YvlB